MRAAVIRSYGQPPALEDFDDPGDGVEVLAAGLNPIDLRIASGTLPASPPVPYVAGLESVVRTADGRVAYARGSVAPFGSLAERTQVDPAVLVDVPDGLDPAHAVCFGVAGLAGYLSVWEKAQVADGETVLVLGATGTVGLIAVQVARLLGAGRVVAAGRSPSGLDRAAELGADATVVLTEGASVSDMTAAFREAAGGDVHTVIDPLWGEPASAAVDALAWRGKLVQLGQSAGAEASLKSATVRFREISIIGHTNFASPPEVQATALRRMWAHALAGELVADHETVALADVASAWRRQVDGPGTKLVVVP